MPTSINESLIITSVNKQFDPIEIFLNSNGSVFVGSDVNMDARDWFFIISREDWPEIKGFIDAQFEGQ